MQMFHLQQGNLQNNRVFLRQLFQDKRNLL